MKHFITRCVVGALLGLMGTVRAEANVFVYRGTVKTPQPDKEVVENFILVHDTQAVHALRVNRGSRAFRRTVLPFHPTFSVDGTKFTYHMVHDSTGPNVSDGRFFGELTLLLGVGQVKNERIYETNSQILAPRRLAGTYQYFIEGGIAATFYHTVDIFDLSFDTRATQRIRAANCDVSGAIELLASELVKARYSETTPSAE